MKSIFNRLSTLVITTALVVAQVIMPAQAAFADNTHDNGTYQPVWCHLTGNSWKAQPGNESSGDRHDAFALLMTQAIKNLNLDNIDNTVTNGLQVMAHDRSDKLDAECAAQSVATTPSYTAVATCDALDPVTWNFDATKLTISPATPAYNTAKVISASFTPIAPYSLLDTQGNPVASLTLSYADVQPNDCAPVVPKDATASIVVSDATCTTPGIASVTGLAYATLSSPLDQSVGAHVATFTAANGHQFADGSTSLPVNYTIPSTLSGENCPVPPTTIPTPVVTVNPICGVGNDTLGVPTSEDYTSSIAWNNTHTTAIVTFTIKPGVNEVFSNGKTTVDVTVDEQDTATCTPTPTPCTVHDQVYLQPWQYNGSTSPVAGIDPDETGTVPGSYEFTNNLDFTGLRVKTPSVESFVYGYIDAGNTHIQDVDKMEYTTYRMPMVARFQGTLPAYRLLIDKDGILATNDTTHLYYEPYYNHTVNEGEWKTWNALDSGDAIWWESGTGQAQRTWDYFKTKYENAIVLAYGFNQGSWNEGTDAYIKSITFDCATTTFSAPGRGSAGGETPTTPTTPTLPTTPVIETPAQLTPGKGAVLPAELPKTGASFNYLSLAILASVLTYGAVYFAQGKRQYE